MLTLKNSRVLVTLLCVSSVVVLLGLYFTDRLSHEEKNERKASVDADFGRAGAAANGGLGGREMEATGGHPPVAPGPTAAQPTRSTTAHRVEELVGKLRAGDGSAAAKIAYELQGCAVVFGLEDDVRFVPDHWAESRLSECRELQKVGYPDLQATLDVGVRAGSLSAMVASLSFPPPDVLKNPDSEGASAWARTILDAMRKLADKGDRDAAFETGRHAIAPRFGEADPVLGARYLDEFLKGSPGDPRAAYASALIVRICSAREPTRWRAPCVAEP